MALLTSDQVERYHRDGVLVLPDFVDANGRLTRPKEVAVNKIGHALHDLDPMFEAFRYAPELVDVATDIGLNDAPLPAAPDELEPLEVEAGTMVVLHGLLPHWSGVNTSDRRRHAYSLHCISGTAHYPASNWLQRRDDLPLRRLDHRVMS